jgi:hypothetical protein
MSKKKKKADAGRAGARPAPARRRLRRARAAVIAPLALCVIAAGAASLKWEPLRRVVGLAPAVEPAAQTTPTPLQLSKEYVYDGGRLVATEEPTPVPSGPPPTGLVATATVSSPALPVSLTWGAPSSGVVTSYVVERAESRDNSTGLLSFAPVNPPAAKLPTAQSPYLDQTASAGKVYVYRVKANFAGGGSSAYSNVDVATTVSYTGDDPLVGANHQPGQHASVVSALNLTELRGVVNSVRALAGLGAAAWKGDPAPQSGGRILAAHFQELRDNLNPALAALGIAPMPPDSTLGVGQPVKAVHIQDVRDKVR